MNGIRYKSVVLLVCLALLTSMMATLAQDSAEIPEVSFVASDDGVVYPAEFPAGVVSVMLENNRAEKPYNPLLAALKSDVTMEDFNAAIGSENPLAALELITLYGGSQVMPEASQSFIVDLPPGNYVTVEEGEMGFEVESFAVTENNEMGAAVPEADVTVALVDFAFGLPLEHQAGPQTWLLENVGHQWHEMGVFKVDEGMTVSALRETLMNANPEEELPYEPVFFWAPMGPGGKVWVTVDLDPGTYAVICFLPDISAEEGTPHFAHGMEQIITVS